MDHALVYCGSCLCSQHLSFLLHLPMACFGWVSSFPSPVIWRTSISWCTLSFSLLFCPVSLLPHVSHELYFIFAWYPLLASSALQCFWVFFGHEDFEATVLQFLFLQPTSSVYCLERRTTLTACSSIPKYQCGNSESVVWQKANLFCRNANKVLILWHSPVSGSVLALSCPRN